MGVVVLTGMDLVILERPFPKISSFMKLNRGFHESDLGGRRPGFGGLKENYFREMVINSLSPKSLTTYRKRLKN
jgi:hypothetical protein